MVWLTDVSIYAARPCAPACALCMRRRARSSRGSTMSISVGPGGGAKSCSCRWCSSHSALALRASTAARAGVAAAAGIPCAQSHTLRLQTSTGLVTS